MKRSSNSSILGKYSETNLKKKKEKDVPAMVNYEQRFKADSMAKDVTQSVKPMTLSEKIAQKNSTEEKEPDP